MSDILSRDYVLELLKAAVGNKKVMEVCARHLKYELLETESQKRIFKHMLSVFNLTGSAPTIGTLAQAFAANEDALALLTKMKKLEIKGKEDQVLSTFETFIKDIRFQSVLTKVADLYNNNKAEEAVKVLAAEGKAISEFTIKENYYIKVFEQFDERMQKRALKAVTEEFNFVNNKLTTGIHEFDIIIKGGFKRGTSFLAMARSGVGKTTFLRWVAIANARLGKKVVFFQAESTADEAMEGFDMAWTALTTEDVETGSIPEHLEVQFRKIRKEIVARGGEIILVATEQFDSMTIEECDERIEFIEKQVGPIDMALFDYLEIFSASGQYGKGEASERRRREDVANKMTNIATKRNIVVGSATQSVDIAPEILKNADFVMTRHHASEFKNVIKPFSYFFTFNATDAEVEQQTMRIYMDKFRKHRAGQVVRIVQARHIGRFYDAFGTKTRNWTDNNKKKDQEP